MPIKKSANVSGFTLIELVIVILLMGIISVTITLKWPATSLNLEFEARRLLYDIRYVQALSMVSGQRYRWVKISSTTYQLTNEAGTAVLLPSGSTQLTFTNGVMFGTLVNLPNSLVAFDSQGVPYSNSSIPGTVLSSTASIPLTVSGQTRVVQITAQTGYGILS